MVAALASRDIGGHEQTMGVENGKRMQQHIIGCEAPFFLQRHRVGLEIAMAEHGALGSAGGARGIENGSEIIRCHGGIGEGSGHGHGFVDQAAGAVFIQSEDGFHKNGAGGICSFGRTDKQFRLGIGQEM